MNVFDFARLVELNRQIRRDMLAEHCPLCGCSNMRWAGCNDAWHVGRTDVRADTMVDEGIDNQKERIPQRTCLNAGGFS